MNGTETTRMAAPRSPLALEGDSPVCLARAPDVARTFVDGLDPASAPEAKETLALVVSELATNALCHGGGHYILELGDP
jgi:hypothetical protein